MKCGTSVEMHTRQPRLILQPGQGDFQKQDNDQVALPLFIRFFKIRGRRTFFIPTLSR
jgi:hypothetical protein